MCLNPQIFNGYEVSCRVCDHCVATYKNTWVARCVAEKQTLQHAYAFTLTYADVVYEKTGEKVPPLGARVFRYKDVQDMWKRIRAAGKRKWGENIELRYVVVGEKGTRFGRCHYHGVFFSDRPIHELGKISHRKGTEFVTRRRIEWSLWGHGFVEFQEADRKGMSYALKYILKSRMSAKKSKGTKREGKSEWLASSYLWSSQVAIGTEWLWGKLNDLIDKGVCPPALRMRVPGGGDWYVSGELQKQVCLFLKEANEEYRENRGKDLAGWSILLQSVSEEIENLETGEMLKRKPWEWLVNGEEIEEKTEYTPEQIEAQAEELREWYKNKRRIAGPISGARATVRKCGNVTPCEACRNGLIEHALADLEQEYKLRYEQWYEEIGPASRIYGSSKEQFEEWWLTRLRPSRGCALRDTEELRNQFERLVPINKAGHGVRGKAAIGKTLQRPPRQP